jgi:N-acetylglucosaminyldiphosphoundecaprenol N-acetyl-beta-D-mannosaminyltransferase
LKSDVLQAGKCDILKVKFDLIAYHVVMDTIKGWKRNGERHYVTITNPHSVMLCHRDPQMRKATEAAGMVMPDGVGIIIAAYLLGYPHNGRVTGPELMLKLCDWGRKENYRHFFYGGAAGIAEKLSHQLAEQYPSLKVAGTYCPPFRKLNEKEDADIVELINAAGPDILWVGLGAPKQEKWMANHLNKINATVMIGVGAAFDFHSGNVGWAPPWVRKCGLEWVYRLAQEPKRMWRKNLDTPIFLAKVFRQRLQMILKKDTS